ncbi:MAG: RHS repeat-associated core domain-containing protein [Flavobacterium sp.]|uniref:RHS repeat-associated core domain-containing protein n=1 Tax=Flavobacterium sp. TaxID=239 RepID=UPI0022C80F29|nr:RHS repeat-associated core domain-containing protein [Flavobacterium sp.]MCZ8169769.1 RHS repeat-associated core domain-containing protein [Flavobacterium sp.]MCZ8296991.1 RHS repeat-associated core domain-containing protein [Flavobacterium sp.]
MAEQRGQHYYNSPYKFNGKELDEETGLYYYGARYYDPKVSIWLSVDPLAEVQPDKTPYHFCSNNPVSRVDPTGMLDEWVQKDGQMMYDNRVTDQKDATELYGKGAIYRPNGYTYTASDGSNIELGDYGFFKQNGQIKSSPDLAQNSLAYTNPIQAMANAQSQIAEVRGNYKASAGVVGFISTDSAIPEPTDAAWPKWVAYGIAGGIAAYYVAKMEAEIEGIKRRAGGPQGVQYSLRATSAGAYTCYNCESGTMNLGVGDVWKYGETINPVTRYSQTFRSSMGVEQFDEFYGNQVQIKVMEKTKIYAYFLQKGHLPPGNKIFR